MYHCVWYLHPYSVFIRAPWLVCWSRLSVRPAHDLKSVQTYQSLGTNTAATSAVSGLAGQVIHTHVHSQSLPHRDAPACCQRRPQSLQRPLPGYFGWRQPQTIFARAGVSPVAWPLSPSTRGLRASLFSPAAVASRPPTTAHLLALRPGQSQMAMTETTPQPAGKCPAPPLPLLTSNLTCRWPRALDAEAPFLDLSEEACQFQKRLVVER